MPTFAFPYAPALLKEYLHCCYGMLPDQPVYTDRFHVFGTVLMPDYYPRGTTRLVSCYALFK